MGTNVQLGSPVCIDRSNGTIGIGFMNATNYLQRPSSNKLILSDSGIQLDLFHEDDDLIDLNGYSMVEPNDRTDLTGMSPAYKDEVKIEPHCSSQGLDAISSHEKLHDSSSSESSCKSVLVHRSKGRPAKVTNGGSGAGSGSGVGSSNLRGIIQCPVCSKMFNNSSALAKHKLIHSDERKYSCSVCSKAFKRQDHLNGHMMTHSSKKPYECKFLNCDKSYCDQRSLRRHIENHHQQYFDCSTPTSASEAALQSGRLPGNSGESVFQFDATFLNHFSGGVDAGSGGLLNSPCGISPTSASHKGGAWPFGYNPLDEPKPVKCTVCDRRFKNLPALNGHMRLHGGFVKKDLTEAEKLNEELSSSKAEINESRDTASKDSSSACDWPSSCEGINIESESMHLKQEVDGLNDDDQCYDLPSDLAKSDYPDYVLQTHDEDFKNQFFVDKQLLSPDALPQMEDLKLKDNLEHGLTMGNDAELFIAKSLVDLMDDPNVTGSGQCGQSRRHRSASDQQQTYADHKFSISDDQHFSPLSLKIRSHATGEAKLMESMNMTDQVNTTFGRYKMPGSSGNLASSGGSLLSNSPSNPSTGHHLRKNPLSIKGRNHITRPLTPSYAMQHGYSSVLPCTSSAAYCGSSTPCTPHSPYPARAVYPATHNQPQTSTNSTFFEFPPRPGLIENGILSRPATPVHPGYGLSQQHTPHTPLSPYTPQPNAPYTPKNPTSSSRLSRFPFPPVSGLMESGTCESPYSLHHPKSTYHPYSSHHHSQPSPLYAQRQQQQQLKSQNFEQDVLEMDKEIEQRLKILIQEDAKKMNITQLQDPALFGQPQEPDLRGHHRSLGEVEQKPAPSSHLMAPCLGLGQTMIGDVATFGQNQLVSQQMTKRLNQEDGFLDEKMDQTGGNDFDMDLELEPLNIRFSDQSIEQTPSDLDVLELLLSDSQFGGASGDMAMDIPSLDVLGPHNEGTANRLASSFGAGGVATSVPSHGVMIAQGVDQHSQQQHLSSSVQKWMNLNGMSQFEMDASVSKGEIFLNPNQLEGYKKKKKHRPGPIVIPPCVNNFQTVTRQHYPSSNVIDTVRKSSVLPSHPPPPYTALPRNTPGDEGRGSFQMAFSNRTPQSAPTFHFADARQMCDQSNEMMNREKEMFSWDQNVLDSVIGAEVHRFQDSSCYTPISDGIDADENSSQRLQSKNESTQDESNRFGATSQNNLNRQEFGVWKLDEMNSYRQNQLEKGKSALR